MFDAQLNLIKELHMGPISIDLSTKSGRQKWGSLLVLLGFILLTFVYVTPIGQSMAQIFKDVGLTVGILSLIAGGVLVKMQ